MKKTWMLVVSALAAVLVHGCSVDRSDLAGPADGTGTAATLGLGNGFDWPAFLDGLDYEEIAGTVVPGQGTTLIGEASTWPQNCSFGLNVPPSALPSSSDSVLFSLRFPTYDAYLRNPEVLDRLVLRLGPDGATFEDSLTVYATWMPWLTLPEALKFYHGIYPPDGGMQEGDVGTPRVTWNPTTKRFNLEIKVLHFSDWFIGDSIAGK